MIKEHLPHLHGDDLSLSHGHSALLLYYASLGVVQPDEEIDQKAHQTILKIKETIEAKGFSDLSLFSGLAGICYAIQAASKHRTRYQKLLKKLEEALIRGIDEVYFRVLSEKYHLRLPAYAETWEIVSGITGIGAYLLTNLEYKDALVQIIDLLSALTGQIQIGSYLVPGWYQPRHYQFIDADKALYPLGNFNLGMAHGITGVLAFLSLAQMKGIYTSKSIQAMDLIASWLREKKQAKNGRFYWPTRISFEQQIELADAVDREDFMDAWCYGTAGVARTLFIYGKATQNTSIQKEALEAFVSMDATPSTYTFCHGVGGLLTLTELMEEDTGSSQLQKKAVLLREILERHPKQENEGLLDGEGGILLALLGKNAFPIWTPIFLISGSI